MTHVSSRRRFIGITAAAAGLALAPLRAPRASEHDVVTWHGQALGAAATMRVRHHDRDTAVRLIERSLAEVRRLEAVFSLYRTDSALVTLNREGALVGPPADLVDILRFCRTCWDRTGGAFDPTVQVLWTLYRDHFTKPGADPQGPRESDIRAALAKTGFGEIRFDANRIVLPRRGMALTLNGVAQGYVTDRVVELLRAGGMANSLVDMGEARALGLHPSGHPWRVGVADPDHPMRIRETLEIVDHAIATSGGYGFRFDGGGRFHHLFDPRTGRSAAIYKSVTVTAGTAAEADALSTAFSFLGEAEIASVLGETGAAEVRLVQTDGTGRIVRREGGRNPA